MAAMVLSGGCAPGDADGRPANLLLITLDTTRADRLGCYGNATAATPNLDGIARDGALFETSIAVGPVTLPSHLSLLTGQYPPRHLVRLNGDVWPPDQGATLAGHLARQGYSTAAVVSTYVLSADFGIAKGFASYDEPREERAVVPAGNRLRHQPIVERPANESTDKALELLSGSLTEPFFLWVHYYDPHSEYEPPEPFASQFADNLYDGEIAFVDAQIGRILDRLGEEGRLDRTLVAVTADHGESLGEHGENTHGLFVYDATLRVPLLLRLPAEVPAGTRHDRLVSGVDLSPTLLDLLELPALDGVEGQSFAAEARGQAMSARSAVYAESRLPLRSYGWSPLYVLHDGQRKLIDAPQVEFYDLRADPRETSNLASTSSEEVDEWRRRLAALQEGWAGSEPETQPGLDEEARRRLSALGYISGGAAASERTDRPDPKRLANLHNLMIDLQTLLAHGALPQAREILERALELDPDNPAALELSGTLMCTAGDCEQGIELLQAAARRSPRSYQTQRNLGNALHLTGRLAEAADAYRAAIALRPFSAEDHYALGNVLYGMRDLAGAIGGYEEAIRLGLDAPVLHAALGTARAAAGDVEGARASLLVAVEADPGLADAWNRLGILTEKAGRLDEARAHYAKALEAKPEDADARFNHAKVALRLGALEEADADLEKLLLTHPGYSPGRYLEAQLRLAQGDDAGARRALERFLAQPDADPRLVTQARELLRRLSG